MGGFDPRAPERRRTGLTADYARDLFSYDPEAGVLNWKPRPREHFRTERQFKIWNTRHAFTRAGTVKGGRRVLCIDAVHYLAYRVIWLIHHNDWPDCIDHINGDALDDRIENLRSVTHAENCRNRAGLAGRDLPAGVYRHRGAFTSRLVVDGKNLYFGLFDNVEAALAARKAAQRKLGFHENHGRA